MLARRALIVDRDKTFVERLRRCLQALDYDLDVARGRREALEYLASGDTAIVFLAVEQPKKSGFKAFTDVKQRARSVPIVLASSTVPMAELLLHQKLRLHADAYIDKGSLSVQQLLETLDRLLQLNLDPAELLTLAGQARVVRNLARRSRSTGDASRRSVVVSRTPGSGDAEEETLESEREDVLSAVDPELVALLNDVSGAPVVPEPHDDELDEADEDDEFTESEEIACLQEEVQRLKSELAQAKRSASSSPFSTDYLALSEQADAEKRSNARLRREHASRARQVEALRAKLLQVADRLLRVERLRDRSLQHVRTLKLRTDSLERELDQSRKGKDDLARRFNEEIKRREDCERQHASDLESFEKRLDAATLQTVEAEARHEKQLAKAEQSFLASRAEAIERERHRLDEERQLLKREYEATAAAQAEAARKEQAEAIEEERHRQNEQRRLMKEEYEAAAEAQAETWRQEQAAALEEQQRRLEEERQLLKREYEAAVQAQAEAWRKQQRTVVEEKDAEWQRRLDKLRSLEEHELNVWHEDHQKQLSELRRSMEQAVRAKEQELATLRADAEAGEQLQKHQAAQYEENVRELRQEHAGALEKQSLEHDAQLEELKGTHACALATLEDQHGKTVDQLIAAHQLNLVERDRQRAEAVEQALASARREHIRDAEARLDDFESSRLTHQENLAKSEQLHKEQVELLEQLHAEQLDRQKIQHEREQDRLRDEHAAAIAELEHSIREEQELTVALKQAEWQTQLEEVRQEQAQTLAAERKELQVLIDAVEAVKGVERSEEGPAESTSEGEGVESSSTMLREIAEEMDRLGEPAPALSPAQSAEDQTGTRSD
jgi:CheY-like chemotaxis protein